MMIAPMKDVHARLLSIAKATAEILEKHNIPYTMAYGTMLGAVRHKGFIPWDDDLDFFLFEESYSEALEYLRDELPNVFFLEDEKSEPLYFHTWAHVKDLHSYTKHARSVHDDSYKHRGLHVDLYKLHEVMLSDLNDYLNSENHKYIMRRKQLNLISDEEYNERLAKLHDKEILDAQNPVMSQEKVYALINFYKCKYLSAKDIFPLKKYVFEDTTFYGVNNFDKVLTDIYGDYMTPPPESDRKQGHCEIEIYGY